MKNKEANQDLNLMQIIDRFSTNEEARAYLESIRWPNGVCCPRCGNATPEKIWKIKPNPEKKIRDGLYDCGECHRQFTVTVGTVFESSRVEIRQWLIAWYLLMSSKKGFAALQLQRVLGLGSYRTAWFMMHRIRYALQNPMFPDKLSGTVEADETYVGGKTKGMGAAYKGNKVAVVSLVERGGRVRSQKVDKVTGANLREVLDRNVDKSAVLMTDDFRGYKKPGEMFKEHHSVNHSAGEYVRGNAHTNTIEGYFSLVKRGVIGVYHHWSERHIGLYLAEFDFRYDQRKATDGERTVAGIEKIEGKRLQYRESSRAS